MRDWTVTLNPASFRGVPFWIERDSQETGRRLDVVEIPAADAPIIEDLGARQQPVEIAGYFVGDVSDAQMTTLEAACNQAGPGVLVMPAQGPLTARCHHIKRDRMRDKMGYFGFQAAFVLDPRNGAGATAPAFPADYLAQLAFDAGDQLAGALGGLMQGIQI
jgi:prophage DNA circulation protein